MQRITGRALALVVFCLTIFCFSVSLTVEDPAKSDLMRIVDQEGPLMIDVSDKIWEYAEIALMEYKS